jgi:hypothetical protein
MSTNYKKPEDVPSEVLCARVDELVSFVIMGKGMPSTFSMRTPAEVDRDADIVLSEVAKRLLQIEKERDTLKAELADAKKLAMDLICENQGLMHKIDMMNKEQTK